jgi:RNA methyltransferase, TrmH family
LRGLLQKRSTRWSERAFVAEGAELLRTALRAGTPIESVYLAPEGTGDHATAEACEQAIATGARLFHLAAGVLERVADTVTPQPVLTVLPMIDDDAAALIGTTALAPPPGSLLLVMVDVRDPGNAGTVLRTADASGARGVLFSGDSVDPYNPKTVRASAGSLFHVPFGVQSDPARLAAELATAGYRTLGTVVTGGPDYAALDWAVPTAVFLGNESAGLAGDLVAALGGTLAIPMEGQAESLNVGVAAAVLCFEALRQRRAAAGAGSGPGSAASTISPTP